MLSCIDKLLSINNPCGSTSYTGIYDMTDVIGFTWGKVAGIAEGNFKEYSGYQIALKIRRLAAKTMQADLMARLQARSWATNLTDGAYTSGEFKTKTLGGSALKRGTQLTGYKSNCSYAGMKLVAVRIKGSTTLTTTLNIDADGVTHQIQVALEANKTFTLSNAFSSTGTPIFSGESKKITIWIEDINFNPIEVAPNCTTCNGGNTNTCANAKGAYYSGSSWVENKSQAYGIAADVICECNYDKILCALPNDEYKGQILRYAASVQLARLALETERFNYFTIYGREELEKYIAIAQNGYNKRINEYVDSLRGWLMKNTYCGCLVCAGSTLKDLI